MSKWHCKASETCAHGDSPRTTSGPRRTTSGCPIDIARPAAEFSCLVVAQAHGENISQLLSLFLSSCMPSRGLVAMACSLQHGRGAPPALTRSPRPSRRGHGTRGEYAGCKAVRFSENSRTKLRCNVIGRKATSHLCDRASHVATRRISRRRARWTRTSHSLAPTWPPLAINVELAFNLINFHLSHGNNLFICFNSVLLPLLLFSC